MIAKFVSHLKKAERGQSIIILAIAFVVLLGFVGLTTDVSLMFVRYATIRRAVDSASLAAASQMRQGTEEAAVAIAARQFVEFHGLDSVKVLVDTCQTLDRTSPDPEVAALVKELCTEDQRKLVKVTVQAESPTVFLRLLGWQNFTLQASAISETAALDVVLIMDVSESMLTDTSYDDWAKIGMGWAFKPPHLGNDVITEKGADPFTYWQDEFLDVPQTEVNARLWYDHAEFETAPSEPSTDERDYDYEVEVFKLDDYSMYDTADGFPADASRLKPREACRVRMFPNSVFTGVRGYDGRERRSGDPGSYPETIGLLDDSGYGGGLYSELGAAWDTGNTFDGFVPTYNYYGCCNDPGTHDTDADGQPLYYDNGYTQMDSAEADFDFTDLVCQPFKGARDAVELFLEKIDFIRGDRVAFVTFDRSAFLINPWNEAGQAVGNSHMIDRYDYALQTLRRVVGIRAEPNFYVWDDELGTDSSPTAGWGALSAGIRRDADGVAGSVPINYETADGSGNLYGHTDPDSEYVAAEDMLFNYPVKSNCAFVNASLPQPYSLDGATLGQVALPYPANMSQLNTAESWSNFQVYPGGRYDSLPPFLVARVSYDLFTACRGTNIGAALREGNNALLDPDTSRRFGAIWVMVLLSDGAAGASDPVRRNGEKLPVAQPYVKNPDGTTNPQPGEYGSFGVCPYGTRSEGAGEVTDVADEFANYGGPRFPYCSDEDPASRHVCDFRPFKGQEAMQDNDYIPDPDDADGDPILDGAEILQWNQDRGNLYDVDIADCSTYYDVDDYARDWADYIALKDEDSATEELLPTIYTIGFGLTFGDEADPDPNNYIGDYLGEQMLRYISDAGDNNQLDNDYYQTFEEYGSVSNPTVDGGYGLRPCQTDQDIAYETYDIDDNGTLSSGERSLMYEALPPRENCGNYFNAPTADELEFVFDSIASKLFTRLAG